MSARSTASNFLLLEPPSIPGRFTSALVGLWGVAHAIPTRQVLAGSEPVSSDNRRIIVQEWLAEAFTMWGHCISADCRDCDWWIGDRTAHVGLPRLGRLARRVGRTHCADWVSYCGGLVQDLPRVVDELGGSADDRECVVMFGSPKSAIQAIYLWFAGTDAAFDELNPFTMSHTARTISCTAIGRFNPT